VGGTETRRAAQSVDKFLGRIQMADLTLQVKDTNHVGSEFAGMNIDLLSAELSSRRTGLSFQRTRMSADRTLMSVIRTSLSLIGFGFTIYTFFRSLQGPAPSVVPVNAARNFGLTLIAMGVGLLFLGIIYHLRFMKQLRAERKQMIDEGLMHGQLSYPVSLTLIGATLLLLVGLVAIFSLVSRVGPFH
jgi:putative membrane protein